MFTPFKLDKVRNLRFGMRSLSIVEKELGTNLSKLDMENLTLEQASIMLWAGLLHEDPTLTVDGLMDLIDEHSSIEESFSVLAIAITTSFGEKGKKKTTK
jgi:hypothetical protein